MKEKKGIRGAEFLLGKKNVVMVGRGTKITGGKDTGREALVVGVSRKMARAQLAAEDLIPVRVKGMETDVIEVGEIKILNGEIDRKKKHRPAPGGVSIGHKDVSAGTLGCVVRKGGVRMILSNNHVMANMNQGRMGDPILQPGAYDGGKDPDDVIAMLHEFVPITMVGLSSCPIAGFITRVLNFFAAIFWSSTRLTPMQLDVNLVDCALARPVNDADVTDEIFEVGFPFLEAEPEVGMAVKKSGRSSGLTQGQVMQMDVTANVNMGNGEVAIFSDQFAMGPMSEPGDSGSVILTEDNKLVGLLFAGSDQITLANRYSNVKAALRLD